VPEERQKANIILTFKKGKREYSGNCRSVSLTLIPRKVMEQLILEITSRHIKNKKIIRSCWRGFNKRKSCLTNLMNFLIEMTGLVDDGRGVDIAYVNFSKIFDSVP